MSNIAEDWSLSDSNFYPRCGATLHIQQTPCRCVEPEDHSGQHRVTYGGLAIVWFTTWVVER